MGRHARRPDLPQKTSSAVGDYEPFHMLHDSSGLVDKVL
jgi:hypothetical protein